jgi:2-keto-3-deoxy-6-phosphogluconate aldolase
MVDAGGRTDWMHDHFAHEVLSIGLGSEMMPRKEMPSEERRDG